MGKSSSEKHVKLAIAGNPNSGKTTLFNILTGLNQRTGNFAGVTVERKSGYFNTKDSSGRQKQVEIVDLPGAYSLNPLSPDERIASQVLTNSTDADYPDGVIVVADASNLKRNLFLVTQIIDTGLPVVLVLNMIDQVEKQGEKIHVEKLSEQLGVNVYEMNYNHKYYHI